MATGITNPLLLLPILLPLLSISAAARPCKTIFFTTTTTTTTTTSYYPSSDRIQKPLIHQNPIPNPTSNQYRTFFVTDVHRFHNPTRPYPPRFNPPIFSDRDVVSKLQTAHHPFDAYSSIRDRTMDIMSNVGSLLFGFGCGSMTAATMYLIWSLFNPRRFDFGDSDDEFDDVDEDDTTPKKMGYVAIPAAGAVTTMDFPTAAVPAKESERCGQISSVRSIGAADSNPNDN